MGQPKTGKTWAALTAPNPIVIDLDNNIPRNHPKFNTVQTVPIWDSEYCVKELGMAKSTATGTVCKYEAVIKWLKQHVRKLQSNQTLIIDSLTFIGDNFDMWWEKNPQLSMTKTGQLDKFKRWNQKIIAFEEIHDLLTSASCNVIGIIHEQDDYDEEGHVIGIKPILTGSYAGRLGGRYTEAFRQRVKVNKQTGAREYIWSIKSDGKANSGGNLTSLLEEGRTSIPANFGELERLLKGESSESKS